MRSRLIACLKQDVAVAQHKINNRLLAYDPNNPKFITTFIERWFSLGEFSNEKKAEKTDLIKLLTSEAESSVLKKFQSDVFSLALACAFVEKQGVPAGAAVRDWYRLALIDHLETQRLGLRYGNLQFYSELAKAWKTNWDISEFLVFSAARQMAHPSFPVDNSALRGVIQEQAVLITIKPSIYRFSSPTMKKALMRLSDVDLRESESLAIANLLGNYGRRSVL